MATKRIVIFRDVIKGDIASGWALCPHTSDEDFVLAIKQWFRENDELVLRGKRYTYSTFMECITDRIILDQEIETLMGVFGEFMSTEGAYSIFPVRVIAGVGET